MSLPEINSYGRYSSSNYGAHALVVNFDAIRVWFSYQTPVAFQIRGQARVVRENSLGPTTGKHLNWIDDRRGARVSSDEFERLWKEQVEELFRPASDWSVNALLK